MYTAAAPGQDTTADDAKTEPAAGRDAEKAPAQL